MTRLPTRSLLYTFVVFAILVFVLQSTRFTFRPDAQLAAVREQTTIPQDVLSLEEEEQQWNPETDLTIEATHVSMKKSSQWQ